MATLGGTSMPQPDQPDISTEASPGLPVWFLTIVTLPILLGLLWFGRDFLIPIAMATLLFFLNMALIDRLDSATVGGKAVPRPVAYIGATALIVGVLIGFGYVVANQVAAIGKTAPKYADRITELKGQLENLIGADRIALAERAVEEANIEGFLTDFAASAAGAFGNVGLILIYLFFMLAERGAFAEKLPRLCGTPAEARRVENIFKSISVGVRQYMWINAVTSAMSATLSFVVLKFLGVDFAATLALAVFFLNFIPNIGFVLAVLIQASVALVQFDTLTPILIIVVVYGGGDAIIGNIVQPRMQGKSLNLSTFVVMVALTFWGMMWGGVGALVAVPLTVVIMIVCSQIPGLQAYARLLSSDGVLQGEPPAPAGAAPADPLNLSEREGASVIGGTLDTEDVANPTSEIEAELAVMKQELLEEQKSRRRATDDAAADVARTRPDKRRS